ncbi:MAG: DUF502 domain-containing protein [Pirellulales bacterium]
MILVWVWRTLDAYVLSPVQTTICTIVADSVADIRLQPGDQPGPARLDFDGQPYVRVGRRYVPAEVYEAVKADAAARGEIMPPTARLVYYRYVQLRWLRPYWFVPASVVLVVGLTYVLGRIANQAIGRITLGALERGIQEMPVVRTVYSAAKQVTDRMLAGPGLELSRVVAVEYPRPGVWSVAFVVNEGMYQVAGAAKEPVLTVLFDTSPVPVTGYATMVKKSETIPLDLSVEDAVRHVISCGIVVPPHQMMTPARVVELANISADSPR